MKPGEQYPHLSYKYSVYNPNTTRSVLIRNQVFEYQNKDALHRAAATAIKIANATLVKTKTDLVKTKRSPLRPPFTLSTLYSLLYYYYTTTTLYFIALDWWNDGIQPLQLMELDVMP